LKSAEVEACKANGVADIMEIKFGYDGVALVRKASFAKSQPMNLTAHHLWLAMAAQVPVNGALVANPYKMWNEIDPSLPATAIHLYVGPEGNNPRQMAVDYGAKPCMADAVVSALAEAEQESACGTLRADGVLTEFSKSRETVEALVEGSEDVIAISAYGLVHRFGDDVGTAMLDGVAPNEATIIDGSYPLARSQYLVVKTGNMSDVPGLRELVWRCSATAPMRLTATCSSLASSRCRRRNAPTSCSLSAAKQVPRTGAEGLGAGPALSRCPMTTAAGTARRAG
jgi:phosphate transport system substrate-binding protein